LDRFPQLDADLSDAKTATRLLKEVKANAKVRQQEINNSAISEIAGDDNVPRAVNRILSGKSPESDYANLATTAKEAGEEAVLGLRAATLKSVSENSRGFVALRDNLDSALKMMEKNNVFSGDELNRFRTLMNRAAEIETNAAKVASTKAEQLTEHGADQAFDLGVRILGAKLGAAGAAGTTGASIVAAGAGSRFLRNVMEKIPFNKSMELLEEAARNPRLMKKLLTRIKSEAQGRAVSQEINGALIAAGIIDDNE
jgi:hypothetical protein